jgi:hypothetical protein
MNFISCIHCRSILILLLVVAFRPVFSAQNSKTIEQRQIEAFAAATCIRAGAHSPASIVPSSIIRYISTFIFNQRPSYSFYVFNGGFESDIRVRITDLIFEETTESQKTTRRESYGKLVSDFPLNSRVHFSGTNNNFPTGKTITLPMLKLPTGNFIRCMRLTVYTYPGNKRIGYIYLSESNIKNLKSIAVGHDNVTLLYGEQDKYTYNKKDEFKNVKLPYKDYLFGQAKR